MEQRITTFLAGESFAVVGASRDRSKYGNKVLRAYQQNDRRVFPVNPHALEVEGLRAFPNLTALPIDVHGVSIVTPPRITASVVEEGLSLGIKHFWMQPGAEDDQAVARATEAGANVIAHGPCALVLLGYHE